MRINNKKTEDYGLIYNLSTIPLRPKKIENMVQIPGIGLVNTNMLNEYENYDLVVDFTKNDKDLIYFINQSVTNNIFNDLLMDGYMILHFYEYTSNTFMIGRIKENIVITEKPEQRNIMQSFSVVFSVKPYKYKIINPEIDIKTITSYNAFMNLKENVDYIKSL